MMEESFTSSALGEPAPKKWWKRMAQVLESGIETAPRETAITPTPARQAERKIIQKSHLLKVQRAIISFQQIRSSKNHFIILKTSDLYLNPSLFSLACWRLSFQKFYVQASED